MNTSEKAELIASVHHISYKVFLKSEMPIYLAAISEIWWREKVEVEKR